LIGACLADGLQYAHDRDLLHMDVKPSNVLLAADGQPMLLDFHLARGPIGPGAPPPAWAGGTPGYMSPEQWGVITAVREGRPVRTAVDRRADIYSLGALMYEALGGQRADAPDAPPQPLRQVNPSVSLGLSDVIQKCLQLDPGRRYVDAAAVANELRRHVGNLPLRGVPNRSLMERWRKWRRRQPVALSRVLVIVWLTGLVLLGAGSFGVWYRQCIRDADDALAQGRTMLDRGQFSEAGDVLRRGMSLTERVPHVARLRAALAHELARAIRASKREELHQIAELIRLRYGLALPAPDEARSLIHLGRTIWEGRKNLIEPVADGESTGVDARTRTDLLDLMVLWARLRQYMALPGGALQAKQEAVRVLTEAKALLGASPSLERARAAHARALGLEGFDRSPAISPRSAWEHVDMGKSYLRSGDIELASQEFRAGLRLRPQDFWLNFYAGLCAYRLKRFEDAAGAFRVAIALAPETAECRYNQGLTYQALGRFDEATEEYDAALQLDERFTDAALNRGTILYQLGRHDAARASLNQALGSASNPQVRGMIHYNLALVDWAIGQKASCATNVQAALDLGNRDARELCERVGIRASRCSAAKQPRP
jgi:tetratricopeptide (TPR) repeat protein